MNGTLLAASAAACLAVAVAASGGEGGGKGGAPAPAAPEIATVRSEFGTWEFQCPSGFTEEEPKKAGIVKQLAYAGAPFLSSKIKVYAYKGYTKPEHMANFMGFFEKSIGGNITYENDEKTRFTSDIQNAGTWWISQVDGKIEPVSGYGIAIECLVPKDVYDETQEIWKKVADSFRVMPPPADRFTVPEGWKEQKGDMYSILGPLDAVKDKKAKDLFLRRMAQVQLLVDIDAPATKLFRAVFSDERKAFERAPIHVFPTTEEFKAAAGDRWSEGAVALYLPAHAERILVVDGSPDGGFRDEALLPEAGVQYVETRMGSLPPWLREAFRLYFAGALKVHNTPGLYPPEMLKRAKEVLGKAPAPFEELLKKDDAGMAALGEDGRVAAWGYFQYGLHGPDAPTRSLFRGYLKDGVGAPSLQAVWDRQVAKYKEESKKTFRPKDFENAARKYFRDIKEEKK